MSSSLATLLNGETRIFFSPTPGGNHDHHRPGRLSTYLRPYYYETTARSEDELNRCQRVGRIVGLANRGKKRKNSPADCTATPLSPPN